MTLALLIALLLGGGGLAWLSGAIQPRLPKIVGLATLVVAGVVVLAIW